VVPSDSEVIVSKHAAATRQGIRGPHRHAITQDIRARFLQYVLSSSTVSISLAARTFGLPVSTGHAIVRKNEADLTNSQNKWGGPRKLKITAEAHHAIEGWVDERPDLTLSCLCTRLADQFAITITWQSMAKFLNRIGFTSKLIRAIPIARNSPEVLQARRQYAQRVVSEAPADRRHVVWVDECGFNLHIRRKYGRSRRGERANVIVASSHGQNLSICAAMSEEGFLYDRICPGAYSAEHFCTFLEELFEHLCERGRGPCWIVLDNVRFHHCAIVSCCAERNGHTLVFLLGPVKAGPYLAQAHIGPMLKIELKIEVQQSALLRM
jgi:transposase